MANAGAARGKQTRAAHRRFADPRVAAHFATYPPLARKQLFEVRELIFATAARTEGVGELQETLKWSEPAYVTAQSKSGTTVRIDWKPKQPDVCAVFFHCQTGLVESFRTAFADDFAFEGNRALLLDVGKAIPKDALGLCIEAALTYHARKRRPRRAG